MLAPARASAGCVGSSRIGNRNLDARLSNGDDPNSVARLNLNPVTRPSRVNLAGATTAKAGDFRHHAIQ